MRPWLVLAAWGVMAALAAVAALDVADRLLPNWRFLSTPESVRAEQLLEQRMLGQELPAGELIIVHSESVSIEDPAFQAAVAQVAEAVRGAQSVSHVLTPVEPAALTPEQAAALISADRRTVLLPVTFVGNFETVRHDGRAYVELVEQQQVPGFEVATVGELSGAEAFAEISERDLVRGELIALPIAAVVLLLVVRALVAAAKRQRSSVRSA
jgi:RND superfamily putative drug exporter